MAYDFYKAYGIYKETGDEVAAAKYLAVAIAEFALCAGAEKLASKGIAALFKTTAMQTIMVKFFASNPKLAQGLNKIIVTIKKMKAKA